MKKEITVDKALIRYNQIDNALIGVVSIAFFAVLFSIIIYLDSENTMIITFVVLSIFFLFIGFAAALSLTFNMWKFWAFSRVENVHELKKRLILLGKVSAENLFFKKIDNSTENDRKYWKIRQKFVQEDVFVDDESIPEETSIYYSKKIIYIVLIFSVIPLFVFGFFLVVMAVNAKYPMGAVLGGILSIIAVIIGYYYGYKKLINREPQLILNNKGIYSNKKGFHKWEEIENCLIISNSIDWALLKYTHSRGHENIKIQNLNIKNNGIKLSKLLMVYHERNKLQIKNFQKC